MRYRILLRAFLLAIALFMNQAQAGSGPLGIDSRLNEDNRGIWQHSKQQALERILLGGTLIGALWEGANSPLGKTFWQSVDSVIVGAAAYAVLNNTTGRLRPSQTDGPNQWGKHGGHSFPSGEVTSVSAIVTPFVLAYRREHPAVYALELLPLYVAEARLKQRGHWQTDVLAGWALGTASGIYAHSRSQPFTVSILPHAITVGWHGNF